MHLKQLSLRYLVYLRTVIWQFYKDKIYYAIGFSVLFGILIWLLNHFLYPSNFWDQFTTPLGINVDFCEFTDMKKIIRQPVNTFTNFVYLVNAIFFLSKGISDSRKPKAFNLITANPYYSIVIGVISLYTFVCSTFFHSSLIQVASNLDYSAVYSVSLFPLMYFSHRYILYKRQKPSNVKHPHETRLLVLIFSIIYLVLTFAVPMKFVHPIVLSFIILIGTLGFLLERAQPHKTTKAYLLFMVIFISIAVVFFKLDFMKVGCDPESFIQPHSIWHISNGLSLFYLYLYFRSENYQSDKDEKLLPFRQKFLEP